MELIHVVETNKTLLPEDILIEFYTNYSYTLIIRLFIMSELYILYGK